jgi:hypothetical protein
MAQVVWKQAEYEAHIRSEWLRGLTELGREAKAYVQSLTPYRTGFARRSVWFAVVDESGRQVAGDTVDGNGQRVVIPHMAGGQGLRLIVGANAPYYIWIEIGTRGRPGKAALARGNDFIAREIQRKLAEAKVRR